ncbi:sugar-binding protein [Streptomyces sp. NPDC057697]|uniref:sugar-binding protein n=1 Tax=Streptomyces sp. NPDC057697 TaxID=3346219 RepID=UPI0036A2D1EB
MSEAPPRRTLTRLRRALTTLAVAALAATLVQAPAAAPAHARPARATAVLGAQPVYEGIERAWPGDRDKDPAHAVREQAGRSCWTMSGDPYNRYLYVDVAAGAVPAGAKRAVVTVDYFDAGAIGMGLQYDSQSNAFTGVSGPQLKGTGTWRSRQFELGDIRFANRANGADFRIDVQATAENMPPVCFSRIAVEFTDAPLLDITSRRLLFTQGTDQGPITFASAADRIDWTIGDPGGVPLKSGTAQVTDGGAALDIRDLGPGYYTLTATADSGAPVTRTTSFGVVAPLPAKDPYYAVALHYGWQPGWEDTLLDSAATVGWSQVRSDVNWAVEKQKGVYDFGAYPLDAGLKNAAERGIRTMPILGYRNPLYDGGKTPSSPEGLAAFARFGAAAAAAYAPYTKDFAVYNEFNGTGFNDGACGITAACYIDMIKAVKQAMPDANVVGPTSAGTQLAWHDDFIARGGLDHLDTFSVNYYAGAGDGPGTPPEEIKALGEFAQLVKKVEARKKMPVWVTENGWPTNTGGWSESQQADYLIRAQTLARAAGADKYFWYDLLDDGDNPGDREHRFGLFHRAGNGVQGLAPKPAAVSNAVLIRQTAGKRLGARESAGDPAVHVYPYGTTTRSLWATSPKTVSVRTDKPLTLTDQFGKRSTLVPNAGRVTLGLDGSPVFLEGPVAGVTVTDSPLWLSTPEQSVTGAALKVTLTADRTKAGALPRWLPVTIDGVHTVLRTRAGAKTSVTVKLPATATTGVRDVSASLGGLARLRTTTRVVEPYTVTGRPDIRRTGGGLTVRITNNDPDRALAPAPVGWRVGPWTGTLADPGPVPAGKSSERTVELPAEVRQFVPYAYSVTTGDATDSGSLSLSPVEPAGATTLAPTDLGSTGNWVGLRGGTRTGPEDLSGTIRYTHTDQKLILDAVIKDDVHHADRTDPSAAWQADSLQYDLYSDFPGTPGGNRVEVGAALLPSGPTAYTWAAPPGQQAGPTPGAEVSAVRDEQAGTTTYRLAVPWTSLGFDRPPTKTFGLSFLVNDADASTATDARDGYLEWGAGVGASPKNPALFRSVRLVR